MALAPQRQLPRMTVELFRAFYASRPDEERWQLIDGVAMMMTPATRTHQRIASNLERLLIDALERHDPTLTAYQRLGVNIAPSVDDYDPEPDVVVVDKETTEDADEHCADRFYLAAEIVSSSDRTSVRTKREVYKLHSACKCILTVQQDRYEVQITLRSKEDWSELRLTKPDDIIALPDFGFRCKVSDLYWGTSRQAPARDANDATQ